MSSRALAFCCLVLVAAVAIGCGRHNPDSCDGSDCGGGSDMGVAFNCDNDGQCMTGLICVGGMCTEGCHSGRDCPGTKPICDSTVGNGRCVACRQDSECAPTESCVDHVCYTKCNGDGECTPPTPKCDTSAHHCVACIGAADCPLGTLCRQSQCLPGCTGDRDCPTTTPRCDATRGADGTCVACFGNNDCGPGQICHNEECINVCTGDSECPSGHCNTKLMVCVECSENTDCPLANVCKLDHCVPGCGADRDCPVATPRCDTTRGNGTCVACIGDGDCPGGTCKDGACSFPTPSDMIAIPAGVFTMGDDGALTGGDPAGPQHLVTLSAYSIDKTEVTNDGYRKCVAAGACQPPSDVTDYNDTTRGNFPVVFVTYAKATDYCAWAGKRLPTEAEWEKAARSTDKRKYPWGAAAATCTLTNGEIGTLVNNQCQDGVVKVGSYPGGASPYGVLDMSGNAREWVYDYSGAYPSSMVTDPAGPPTGSSRQTRGGGFTSGADLLTTYARLLHPPEDTLENIGFRCAKGPTPKPVAPPKAILTVTPSGGTTGTTFSADASQSTDPVDAASTLQMRWKFGDGDVFGPYSLAKTATHRYAANGSYKITVEVRNAANYTAQATRTVSVSTTGAPPDMAGGLGEGESCANSDQCAAAYDCYLSFCRAPCSIFMTCPSGFTCSNLNSGYCLPNGG
jgi:formylglycine-generating enzyme required for sulfatase activity